LKLSLILTVNHTSDCQYKPLKKVLLVFCLRGQ